MAQRKSVYLCQSCGGRFAAWEGRCSTCGEWGTLSEEPAAGAAKRRASDITGSTPVLTPIRGCGTLVST